jgi:asparagine synthase (glutamine-hydrolysing)
MCGIAGVLYRQSERKPDPRVLAAMARAIAHRGPDGEGFYSASGVGLAHRRLSIIDLDGGVQPMGSEDQSIQVVFNGEIYNFQELRAGLLARGHQFRTRSDTEVLVHLYEEHGEDLVHRLRGMFAFALWDGPQRRLVLARDRVGLKPLYIYQDHEKLLFGSELKALLAHPDVDRAVDPAAVDDYLAWGMIPGRRSIFRKVSKLPPAHVVTVAQDTLHCQPRRYWQYRIQADAKRSVEDWCEGLRSKLEETVRVHQIADVPVGAFLSGGLDSSAMVAIQSRLGGDAVQTFSIGFREAAFSELPYAREVARQFGTVHTEEVITPDAVSVLDDLVHYYDEPFADSSAIPTLWVSRLARQHVKVVISGDGGDEAFGGYARYVHDLGEAALRRHLPRWLRRGLLRPLAQCWPKADWLPRILRAKTTLTNLSLDGPDAYANTLSLCRRPLRSHLVAADLAGELNGHRPELAVSEPFALAPADDPLAGMISADVNMLLPDDFLTKVDRASMSCGLEVRPPLVDHELLELAGQVPSCFKVRHGEGKWILKQLYRDRLPACVTDRAKHGFEIPVDQWLRGPLRDRFESSVLSQTARVADLIRQPVAATLYRSHLAGVGRHGNALWSLLVLAHWAEKYLTPQSHARIA